MTDSAIAAQKIEQGADRGQRLVVAMAAAGHRISLAIADRIQHPELAGNVPLLVLCELYLRGPLRPRELMAVTHLTSGGMTKQLDHLESLGLIERAFGTVRSDRRATVVSLTAEGQALTARVGEAIEGQIAEIRSLVSAMEALLAE